MLKLPKNKKLRAIKEKEIEKFFKKKGLDLDDFFVKQVSLCCKLCGNTENLCKIRNWHKMFIDYSCVNCFKRLN